MTEIYLKNMVQVIYVCHMSKIETVLYTQNVLQRDIHLQN